MSSVAELDALFRMDEDGVLYWKPRSEQSFRRQQDHSVWTQKFAGKPAVNCDNGRGYLVGQLYNKTVYAHRIVFKLHYGYEPIMVDHIDHNKKNNRPSNLRPADATENGRNLNVRRKTKTGTIGVWFDKRCGKWVASIRVNGRNRFLGQSKILSEAIKMRKDAEFGCGYHVNHGMALLPVTSVAAPLA